MKRATTDKILLYGTFIIVMAILVWIIRKEQTGPRTVYVDIGKMLEHYKLKKDMEAESSQQLYKIKATIDSLQLLQKMNAGPLVDSQVNHAQRAFDQYYSYAQQEISKKIWERLNPLLEEFGKEQHYEIVIGANGAGNVLYGAKDNDVTDAAINFINTKYEKGH